MVGEQLNRTESVCSRKPESRIRPAFYGRPVCDVLFSGKRNPRANATGPMDDTLENDISILSGWCSGYPSSPASEGPVFESHQFHQSIPGSIPSPSCRRRGSARPRINKNKLPGRGIIGSQLVAALSSRSNGATNRSQPPAASRSAAIAGVWLRRHFW